MRNQEYLPAKNCPIELFVQPIQGGEIVSTQFGVTDDLGEFRTELKGLPPGSYRLEANSGCSIQGAERAESRVVIDELSREIKHSKLRMDILTRIAELTGGKVYSIKQEPEELVVCAKTSLASRTNETRRFGTMPSCWWRCFHSLGAEWSIRRQRGFV